MKVAEIMFKGERVGFQLRTDGYFSIEVTGIGTACRRNITNYSNGTRTKRRIEYLAAKLEISKFELLRSSPGHNGGTWMHEMLAYDFAIGCSDEAYWFVADTLHRLRVDGVASVRDRDESPHGVVMGEMFGAVIANAPLLDDDANAPPALDAIHAQGEMNAIRQIEDREHDRPALHRVEQSTWRIDERTQWLRDETRADHERLEERIVRLEHFVARAHEESLAEQRTTNNWLAKIDAWLARIDAALDQIVRDLFSNVWKGVQWLVRAMHNVRPARQRPNRPTQQRVLDEMHVDKLLKDLRDQDEIRG